MLGMSEGAETFRHVVCLAPMIRASSLPLRLLASEYGADLVWSEEIIASKIALCTRLQNKATGAIEFAARQGGHAVFQTLPLRERVVFQLGCSSAADAVRAAEVVARDVVAVDVNMGCNKHAAACWRRSRACSYDNAHRRPTKRCWTGAERPGSRTYHGPCLSSRLLLFATLDHFPCRLLLACCQNYRLTMAPRLACSASFGVGVSFFRLCHAFFSNFCMTPNRAGVFVRPFWCFIWLFGVFPNFRETPKPSRCFCSTFLVFETP